ncbi:MAG TPA: BON domain-containing protein [Planctomycetota bacterium]|jgi:osmotically-inducible protein OsmY
MARAKPGPDSGETNGRRRDEIITKALKSNLQRVAGKHVQFEVRDGFVTLRGKVVTYRQKERLHRFVMRLKGVRALKDLIEIRPRETLEDRQIAIHIRQALDAHAELPVGTAVVHVRGGVVTLQGHVRSAEECFITESTARHCRGVSKVVNRLTVDPLDEVSDAATVNAIQRALEYCRDFETKGISVSCADGRVVLRGEVPSLLDRALAEDLARLQAGVCSVENLIQVKLSALPRGTLKPRGTLRSSVKV